MLPKRNNTGFGNIYNKNWSGDYELGTMLSHLGFTSSEREFSRGYQDTEISSGRDRSESEGITADAHKQHWTDVTLISEFKNVYLSLLIFAHHISNIFNVIRRRYVHNRHIFKT